MHVIDARQIELDMVSLAAFPRTAHIERMARNGQYPPAMVAENLDRGMPDATAGARQQQDPFRG